MLKNAGIATILGLALMTGCAGGTGSQAQELATGDFNETAEACYHTAGDYDGGDLLPPPITISIGDHEMSATDAMAMAQTDDRDLFGRLLAEFITAQVSIDGGAELQSDDIDALIAAEDMLVQLDADDQGPTQFFEVDTAELIDALGELNHGFSIEVPCMITDNAGVFEVDAPAVDTSRDQFDYATTWQKVVVGTSADETSPAPRNELYRP